MSAFYTGVRRDRGVERGHRPAPPVWYRRAYRPMRRGSAGRADRQPRRRKTLPRWPAVCSSILSMNILSRALLRLGYVRLRDFGYTLTAEGRIVELPRVTDDRFSPPPWEPIAWQQPTAFLPSQQPPVPRPLPPPPHVHEARSAQRGSIDPETQAPGPEAAGRGRLHRALVAAALAAADALLLRLRAHRGADALDLLLGRDLLGRQGRSLLGHRELEVVIEELHALGLAQRPALGGRGALASAPPGRSAPGAARLRASAAPGEG